MPEKLLRPADVAELLGVSYDCACMLMKSMQAHQLDPETRRGAPKAGSDNERNRSLAESAHAESGCLLGVSRITRQGEGRESEKQRGGI